MLDADRYVEVLDESGAALSLAARTAGAAATVPTCPGWTVHELLAHTGHVHRWATEYVRGALVEPVPQLSEAEALAAAPPGEAVFDWFDEGHAALVAALRAAPADLVAWTFLHAPDARTFWSRRQAHETTIHRVDAELAAGVRPGGIDPAFALDGIEELLSGFLARPSRAPSGEVTARVVLYATDAEERWTITVHERGAVVEPGARRRGAVVVAAPIADLYLLCWNRLESPRLAEADLLEPLAELRRATAVRWG